MSSESLFSSLETYKNQLSQVESVLQASGSEENPDLTKLRDDLIELIHLTEDSLLSMRKKEILESIKSTTDTSKVVSKTNWDSPHNSNSSSIDEHMKTLSDDISGSRCRVPFTHPWGMKSYCNAMVVSVHQPTENFVEPSVKVMFCNPTHRSMLPCPHFLEADCRFSDEDCQFSHGYSVKAEDLGDFLEPDYSLLKLESKCLAKRSDNLWYPAVIVGLPDFSSNHSYQITFERSSDVVHINITDLIPADETPSDEKSDFSDSDDESEDEFPVFLWKPPQTTERLGQWEEYTKGIGSKLMIKMGYVMGDGLGVNRDGRAVPIPIQLLPPGKSLDKIMRMKELSGNQNLYDATKKLKKDSKTLKSKSCESSFVKHKTNVFDFMNKKLEAKNEKTGIEVLKHKTSSQQICNSDLKSKSDRGVNIQIFKTEEEIKNSEKELRKMQASLKRNKESDKLVTQQIEKKIKSMEDYIKRLENSKLMLKKHQNQRKDHKKLTVF